MGCYMSTPDNRVYVTEGKGKNFIYATASCQGWRREQEDAEDCIPEYEDNASLFILCDGHGGAEVAKYTVEHLPDFIKNHPLYKEGHDYVSALRQAFIDFDARLRTDEVMAELHKLAMDAVETDRQKEFGQMLENIECDEKPPSPEPSGSAGASSSNNGPKSVVDDVDTETLRREAQLPLRDLLEEYSSKPGIDPAKRQALLTKFNSSPVVKPRLEGGDTKNENGEEAEKPSSSGSSDDKPGPSPKSTESIKESLIRQVIEHYFTEGDSESDEESWADGDESSNDEDGDDEGDNECESSSKKHRRKKHKRPTDDQLNSSSEDDEDDEDDDDEDDDEDDEDEDEDDDDEENEEDADEEEDDNDNWDDVQNLIRQNPRTHTPGHDSGCTVVVALVKDGKIYVASAGDSRCILVMRDGVCRTMSFDHKPDDFNERKRIQKAGGQVTEGRVNGGLNLSRAFGDFTYKSKDLKAEDQMITPKPLVITEELDPAKVEYVFLACDGIWNSMQNQETADFIRKEAANPENNLVDICVNLFRACIAPRTDGDGTGCDNMTCIIAKYDDPIKKNSDLKTEAEDQEAITTTASSAGSSNKRSMEEVTGDLPIKRRCLRL